MLTDNNVVCYTHSRATAENCAGNNVNTGTRCYKQGPHKALNVIPRR